MKSQILKFAFFCTIMTVIASCKKGPGDGGNSSINGYISVIKYNAFFTDTLAIYGGYDEDVYIIYGDDITYGDHLKSGPDGKFEFKYLREGSYKIYVYSDDTIHADTVPSKIAVMKNVEITEKNQEVDAGTFEIKKH
jgi:hypothetical protein